MPEGAAEHDGAWGFEPPRRNGKIARDDTGATGIIVRPGTTPRWESRGSRQLQTKVKS